jgi:hypothetical protein
MASLVDSGETEQDRAANVARAVKRAVWRLQMGLEIELWDRLDYTRV